MQIQHMKTLVSYGVFAMTFALAQATPTVAHDYTVEGLTIDHPWARPTPGKSKVAAVYLSLVNKSGTGDTLVSASSPVAAKIEVHETSIADGIAKMRRLDGGLPIAAGATVKLEPAGMHLMLFGLSRPLKLEERIPLTLEFQKRGKVEVKVNIETAPEAKPDAKKEPAHNHEHHHH